MLSIVHLVIMTCMKFINVDNVSTSTTNGKLSERHETHEIQIKNPPTRTHKTLVLWCVSCYCTGDEGAIAETNMKSLLLGD